jgi:hypothetical protein
LSLFFFHQFVTLPVPIPIIVPVFVTGITVLNPSQHARLHAPQLARNHRLLPLAILGILEIRAGRSDNGASTAAVVDTVAVAATADVRVRAAIFAHAARRAARVGRAVCATRQPFGVLDEFER